ncbi:uncharacterized protein LOC131597131 [Vicia villosa]|uniref:uncharacterized protein LOC131597131 n=1 Tax=Vicia villosa TaxID=3911 RepID=UPI00273AA65C|nr:uncharacterized protein LOC131597131 [Vicia villosa]
MEKFSNFIEMLEVVDLPVLGNKFTRINCSGKAKSIIDRILLSEGIINLWKIVAQVTGNIDISDHRPVWVKARYVDWGPKPFRVFNCWYDHPEFVEFVKQEWNSKHVQGSGAFVLKEKLKHLRDRLRWWNQRVFGWLDVKIKDDVDELNAIEEENMFISTQLNQYVCEKRRQVQHSIWKNLHYKESMLKHKEREIKSEVKRHYEGRFKRLVRPRPKLQGLEFNRLSREDIALLSEEFSREEIKETEFNCEGDRSPGPDGFNVAFIKKCWDVVGKDIARCVQDFHRKASLPRALAASFIALIPKFDHPQGLEEYIPICLIGSIYKIISKLLEARLGKVIGKLTSKSQTTFLQGRQILDGVLVTNEIVDLANRSKKSCLLFKVDFAQAYDCVDWMFLKEMLLKMGFGHRWIKWMDAGVFNSNMSILVNESPSREFQAQRGLRQGDPLSPFLFTIVSEGLTGLVRQAIRGGVYSGFKISEDVSYGNSQTIQCWWGMGASQFLCCKIDSIPFMFLGITVGGNPRRLSFWNPIFDNMRAKLSPWIGRAKKGVDWISWSTVCMRKEDGWLGVKDMEKFNKASLTKWLWRFLKEEGAIWQGILEERYSLLYKRLLFKKLSGRHSLESIWWRDLMNIGDSSSAVGFTRNISIRIGDGSKVPFWSRRWLGRNALSCEFPNLFQVLDCEVKSVKEMGEWVNNQWKWRIVECESNLTQAELEEWGELR